ncbi:MAG: LysR family transcriptional regulator substrate-binding protein, partial [Verrucomicrobiota bacterium]|nr:LysR family transcriptional regulator substrate-binding protein [Verrucomicrobiota bacterium]
LQLHDANQAAAERLLQKQEIDLAVTELEGKPAAGLNSTVLFKLPLVLIVPRRWKIKAAADLWRGIGKRETLISLPAIEAMVRQFHFRLKRLGFHWPTRVEVSAMDLIPIYVSLGFGAGLSIKIPRAKIASELRILPLPGFPPLVVAALWQKNLSRANTAFLARIRESSAAMERQILE